MRIRSLATAALTAAALVSLSACSSGTAPQSAAQSATDAVAQSEAPQSVEASASDEALVVYSGRNGKNSSHPCSNNSPQTPVLQLTSVTPAPPELAAQLIEEATRPPRTSSSPRTQARSASFPARACSPPFPLTSPAKSMPNTPPRMAPGWADRTSPRHRLRQSNPHRRGSPRQRRRPHRPQVERQDRHRPLQRLLPVLRHRHARD